MPHWNTTLTNNPMKANANRCQMVQQTTMSRKNSVKKKERKEREFALNVNVQKRQKHDI